ncbi:N-acetylmuramoyl-L-alanine amidase [Nonomuraea montanisoli]|uniref:N-acetylmuramoyl-L-alanine amidase n=1 Tax=Nonomuraea montanisoli TaxID=2741721 RepID=UPI001F362013|nr:peptidoglycan recognition family protein [Nonomuraea montanisoli]
MPHWAVAGLVTGLAAGLLTVPGPLPGRQADFARAAAESGVPVGVLLGVSYLESRWDSNGGRPSTAGGYGPMHLLGGRAGVDDGGSGGSGAGGGSGGAGGGAAGEPAGGGAATLARAARLTGLSVARLRTDPAANIRGGAAVLASLHEGPGSDPADWYDAVARYAATGRPFAAGGSRNFADEVFAVMREGEARRTDDGFVVRLLPAPGLRPPGGPPLRLARRAECPETLDCEWMPAVHERTSGGGYGNHDRLPATTTRRIDYIVIHDTEGRYSGIRSMVTDPDYVSWHYTVRSADGHVAQHVRTRDVAWHAGNWDINARSIGIEHEGYLAKGATWYTEAMYRSSARLLRYLADLYELPLDRAHVLGHDNVPGTTAESHPGMHEDPGPYWDWAHYLELAGSPIGGVPVRDPALEAVSAPADGGPAYGMPLDDATAGPSVPALASGADASAPTGDPAAMEVVADTADTSDAAATPAGPGTADMADAVDTADTAAAPGTSGGTGVVPASGSAPRGKSVIILPYYGTNQPRFTGCVKDKPARACEPHGASSVWLRTEPRDDAPLVDDIGKRVGKPSTYGVYDHSARASTGQRYAVADRRGDWTAIWYLGLKAWFYNPAAAPTAIPASGPLVTPHRDEVRVYGRAYPGHPAYQGTGVAYQERTPLAYVIRPGQTYTLGQTVTASYLKGGSFDRDAHVLVAGTRRFHQIQLGHRVAFVRARDVRVIR